MKYYLLNTIQRIKQYSKQLDAESVLYNKNWVVFNDSGDKEQFIFRPNKELLISRNGIVSKARWELLATGTILIEIGEQTYLFNAAFQDNVFLVLQLDGNKDYLIMYDNKLLTDNVIKSIQDVENQLNKKYLPVTQPKQTEGQAEPVKEPEPPELMPPLLRLWIIVVMVIIFALFIAYINC